jgi:hypothetical protein
MYIIPASTSRDIIKMISINVDNVSNKTATRFAHQGMAYSAPRVAGLRISDVEAGFRFSKTRFTR